MRLEHAQLRDLLPHRHPMLLIDRVEAVIPGESLEAVKVISGCEPCYQGLPDDYAFPGTLLIESFGQAAAVLWMLSTPQGVRPAGQLPMFVAARDCLLERQVYPGDVLRHRVRLDQTVHGAAFASGESRAGPHRIATFTSMTAVIRSAEAVFSSRTRNGGSDHQRDGGDHPRERSTR
jgi:3-hydroxyacyl-[acyl-carrier-protein] dehydratase